METTMCSIAEAEEMLENLEVFKVQGKDKHGRKILHITGKRLPARVLTEDILKSHLEKRIFPLLEEQPFCMVYFHTLVQRSENFPGISTIRSIYEACPVTVREKLEAVYFVHPGLQSRVFFAVFGRFLFSTGLYEKFIYINRLEYLWDHMRKKEVEIPDYVYDHDEQLEFRPLIDYGIQSDPEKPYDNPAIESSASMYSLRCIS